ncbi:glycosyltransferase involved in cell wall biosynthesis [Dyadobacter jejuensis]|uniref:Glycosyltransferase involved in cell wall biosynthesis n=1 Tax=Dyadobacter jejuensis TaxID=1082580 RepID=A0A316AIS8_9BACT|nr:glycosyltransferase [Dyadobacter jejuensis]PWJ57633.1 glycosyltransferase involved in cell wall biosynthesis [Dyadobacter jejuensis]
MNHRHTGIRLLILQKRLPTFRIPLFEALSARYTLTVAYTDGAALDRVSFQQTRLTPTRLGSLVILKGLATYCQNFQIVICMFDLHWLSCIALAFHPRPFRLILWGAGLSTSAGFQRYKHFDWLRSLIARKADAVLLYSEVAQKQYLNWGLPPTQVTVAPNTIATKLPSHYWQRRREGVKNKLVFIGTMAPRKGIDTLIKSFELLATEFPKLELHFIGDGPWKTQLTSLIEESEFSSRMYCHGQLEDDHSLSSIFMEASACISPGQAGLAVLKSFSFGVPFITSRGAITGGERFNIIDGATGHFYDQDLTHCLRQCLINPQDMERMSTIAFHYYWAHRTQLQMVAEFEAAIQRTLNRSS